MVKSDSTLTENQVQDLPSGLFPVKAENSDLPWPAIVTSVFHHVFKQPQTLQVTKEEIKPVASLFASHCFHFLLERKREVCKPKTYKHLPLNDFVSVEWAETESEPKHRSFVTVYRYRETTLQTIALHPKFDQISKSFLPPRVDGLYFPSQYIDPWYIKWLVRM